MGRKKAMLGFMGAALLIGSVRADRVDFVGRGADINWTNANNWLNTTNHLNSLPGEGDEVRIGKGVVTLTTAVTVRSLKVGAGGPGNLIIDGGSLVSNGLKDYNSAGAKFKGSILVKNGGSATFNSYFMVGFSNVPNGSLVIDQGTVRVSGFFYHNIEYSGTEPINSRTTIKTGGLLDVDKLKLNAGVLDVAGGTLIVRQGDIGQLRAWVEEGRIIAMGGVDGWKINITIDENTGYFKISAEMPIVLGMRSPTDRKALHPIS